MPYDPQTQYRGDTYIAGGMDALSDSVSKGLNEFYDTKKKSDSYQAQIPALLNQKLPDGTPLLTQEEAAKALKGGLGAKEGAIASAATRLHDFYSNAQSANLAANTGHTNQLTAYYGEATKGMQLQNGAVSAAQSKATANSGKLNAWASLINPQAQPDLPANPGAAEPPMVAPAAPLAPPNPNPMAGYYGQ